MIINCDVKGLEVVVAAWLSQDKILMQELWEGVDIHSNNQESFGLTDRVIAKILKFRILYGGTEYGFVHDSDFTRVSSSLKFWRNAIDKYYNKYQGIGKWHEEIIRQVGETGRLITPFGRSFEYSRKENGDLPEAAIKNYPVQGTGADIVSIARVSLRKRFKKAKIKGEIINTIHDSIVFDCPNDSLESVCVLVNDVFKDLPGNISRLFNVDFNLPIQAEVEYGSNQAELKLYN